MVWDSSVPGNNWPTSSGTIPSGQWSHIAFVFDGGSGYSIYINGQLDKPVSNSDLVLYDYGSTAYLGYGFDSSSYFDGKLDEVQAFDEALTDAQVYALYKSQTGNLIDYDEAGNLISDHNGYLYTYDYENRIIGIEKGDGDATPTAVASFAYDALGRRIRSIIDSFDSSGGMTKDYYYNTNWQVLSEYDTTSTEILWANFVYGN